MARAGGPAGGLGVLPGARLPDRSAGVSGGCCFPDTWEQSQAQRVRVQRCFHLGSAPCSDIPKTLGRVFGPGQRRPGPRLHTPNKLCEWSAAATPAGLALVFDVLSLPPGTARPLRCRPQARPRWLVFFVHAIELVVLRAGVREAERAAGPLRHSDRSVRRGHLRHAVGERNGNGADSWPAGRRRRVFGRPSVRAWWAVSVRLACACSQCAYRRFWRWGVGLGNGHHPPARPSVKFRRKRSLHRKLGGWVVGGYMQLTPDNPATTTTPHTS